MSTPLIDNLWRQFRQKWGNEKNLFPVNRKPERAVQAKMGLKNERMKNENESIDHRCDIQSLSNAGSGELATSAKALSKGLPCETSNVYPLLIPEKWRLLPEFVRRIFRGNFQSLSSLRLLPRFWSNDVPQEACTIASMIWSGSLSYGFDTSFNDVIPFEDSRVRML